MGLFGKSNNDIREGGYAQPTDNLPVATLVSEEPTYHNLPQATAPTNPTTGGNNIGGGDCCATAANNANKNAGDNNNSSSSSNNNASDPTVSRFPMMMRECPSCHRESRTRVTTAPSWQTWTASGLLCFLFWPISWVPLVVDSCKTTEHFCVTCGSKVAKVDAFQDCCVEHRA